MRKKIEGTVRLVSYGPGYDCRISFSPYVPRKTFLSRDCQENGAEDFLTNRLGIPADDARTAMNDLARTGNGWIQNIKLGDKQMLAFSHEGVLLP